MNPNSRSHLFLVIAGLLFGVNYWIAKALMPTYLSPLQLIQLRVVGAAILFFILDFFVKHKRERIQRRDLIRFAIAALFGVALNQYLFFEGLNLTTPVDAALIHVLNPILVLLFAAIAIGERLTFRKGFGVLLGASGAIFIILYGKGHSFESSHFIGNILIFANTMAYAIYLIIIKPMMVNYSPIRVMKWIFFFGMIFVTPFSIQTTLELDMLKFTPFAWFSIFYVVVATTFIAYLLTSSALKHLNASVVSFYIYMQPVIAAIIAVFVGLENLRWWQGPAALAIFVGVYLVSRKEKKVLGSEFDTEAGVQGE